MIIGMYKGVVAAYWTLVDLAFGQNAGDRVFNGVCRFKGSASSDA